MNLGNHLRELPAHPRHVSVTSDRHRETFSAPPALDDSGLRPGDLLGVFKGAARYMGMRGNILVAMDYFFGLTQPQDWSGRARPIVWPSAREQSEALGLSLSGVKRLNRHLIELGLILAKDSPTGRRFGYRGHNRQIIEAFGFDLTPMAHRHEEFLKIRDTGRADDAERARLRRRKTVAMKSIGQAIRTAVEGNLDAPELYQLAEQAWAINDALSISADRTTLTRAAEDIEDLAAAVLALYRRLAAIAVGSAPAERSDSSSMAMETVNHDPTGVITDLPNNNYKRTKYPSDSNSSETSSSEFGQDRAPTAERQSTNRPIITLPTVKPMEVVRLAPALRGYLGRDLERCDMNGAIDVVIRAAESYAMNGMGISRATWQQAAEYLGIWGATLAVMVVASKDPDYFSRTPAHYFAGMVARAKDGTLRLDRSIWGLRTRADAPPGKA